MALEKIVLKDLPQAYRSAFNRAQEVIKNGSYEYGVELLKDILKARPGFWEAREAIREAQKQKTEHLGGFGKLIGSFSMNKFILKGKSQLKKNPLEALQCGEEALSRLYSGAGLKLVAEAAVELEAYHIAVAAAEALEELEPNSDSVLEYVANIFDKAGEATRVLKVRQKQVARHPNNLDAIAKLRAAAATASMSTTTFIDDKKGASKSQVSGSKAPNLSDLERGDRIIRSEDDIREMIRRYEEGIAAGQISMEVYRKLAELYQRVNRHQDAVDTYMKLVELQGNLDPIVDRAIEKSQVALYEAYIKQLEKDGHPQEEIDAARSEMINYRLERSQDRVRKYPNDLQMRFELACLLWDIGDVDHALEEFQHSQRNPQRKLESMVYMGRCFAAKERYDMAIEQFEGALSEMKYMDKDKMKALYYEGTTYEAMGEAEKALECFKQIYAVNVGYLDVADRINAYYDQKKENE